MRNSRWQRFRAEVIELDGGVCCRCGQGEPDAVLQVHHKTYIKGRMPWDYPYDLCETLCRGCHAAEHGLIPPRIGWTYLGDQDLGDLCGTCEYCGNEIRYVFYIHHPHWEPLEVGTVCCDNLTGTELASNRIDSVQRYRGRLSRFLSSARWQSHHGRLSISQKNISVEILADISGFRIAMNGIIGRGLYGSLEEAKTTVFDVIENGQAERFFRRQSKANQKIS